MKKSILGYTGDGLASESISCPCYSTDQSLDFECKETQLSSSSSSTCTLMQKQIISGNEATSMDFFEKIREEETVNAKRAIHFRLLMCASSDQSDKIAMQRAQQL